jgi:hypothetical protein
MKFDDSRRYDEVVHFVHVYVMEAHPGPPDPAPFRGLAGRGNAPRQPRTWRDRVELASTTSALLEGNQLMLVDELAPLARTNPMWCGYGPAANSAFLIGQDGRILEAHDWLDMAEMKSAIDNLLLP